VYGDLRPLRRRDREGGMTTDRSHDELGPEARPEELAALADGLLPPARAAQIEAQAAATPELAAELAAQRRGLAALRSAAAEAAADGAPTALRARVEAARRPAPRGRALLGGLAVGAAILAALAVFALLPSGSGGPTVAEAAELATRAPDEPPPPVAEGRPTLLDLAVDGVAFPAWDEEFGWSGVGQRADELEGRTVRTVSYDKDAAQVAYSIVSGDALEVPEDARSVTRDGVDLRVFTQGGRTVVTWLRDEHTCVLSSRQANEDTLTKLAVWKGGGDVTF
jgi:hypothetical protein